MIPLIFFNEFPNPILDIFPEWYDPEEDDEE